MFLATFNPSATSKYYSLCLHRNCGEMAYTDERSSHNYETGPTCASGSTIIYAWAMDADKTELPKG